MDMENDKPWTDASWWDGFWDGYEEFLNDYDVRRNMTQNLLDNVILDSIISQGIPKDKITFMSGKPNQNYIQDYMEHFASKKINEMRSENLKKMLDD